MDVYWAFGDGDTKFFDDAEDVRQVLRAEAAPVQVVDAEQQFSVAGEAGVEEEISGVTVVQKTRRGRRNTGFYGWSVDGQ